MQIHAMLISVPLFLFQLCTASESATGDPIYVFPSGASMQIDLMKRNSSELARTFLSEPSVAVFTGDTPLPSVDGITGELVPFTPLDGCQPLTYNPLFHATNTTRNIEFQSLTNSTNFIVLMRRGKCDFANMIENAAMIPHVVGVLIFDPNGSSFSTSLSLKSDKSLVPAFYISGMLGEDLLKKVMKYREVAATTTGALADENPWVQIQMRYTPIKINMAKMLQIFLVMVVVALVITLLGSMIWNHKLRNERSEASENPQPPPRRRPEEIPIDEDFLAKIPRRSYRSPNTSPVDISLSAKGQIEMLMNEDEDYRQRVAHNETCPICLDEFMYGVEINQLHCGHCYHPKCIIPWLQARSPLCPLCNIDVRISMIEAEELAFVRSLRRLQRAKSMNAASDNKNGAAITTMNVASGTEMREVYVVSAPSSSQTSIRIRNASFDSIPLEAAAITVEDHARSRSIP